VVVRALKNPDMLTLSTPEMPHASKTMRESGGFCWWYMDGSDDAGNGFVLIWSFGLPFLPGRTSAARRGRASTPDQQPSLNIAFYRDGRPDFYLLQQFEPEQAHWDGADRWSMGRNRMEANTDSAGRRTVDVHLDLDLPVGAGTLTGSVTLTGAVVRWTPEVAPAPQRPDAPHWWSPVCGGARARVDVSTPEWRFAFDGPAYHDRNASSVHIDGLGIADWTWARFRDGDDTWILYHVRPLDLGALPVLHWMCVGGDGEVRHRRLEFVGALRTTGKFGMRQFCEWHYRDEDGPVELRQLSTVDDGFFYARKIVEVSMNGRVLTGVAEEVVPPRVDRGWQRPLVNMAVHRPSGRSSIWLALFSGPIAGRWRRLLLPSGVRRLRQLGAT
jgi:hypothetical protein